MLIFTTVKLYLFAHKYGMDSPWPTGVLEQNTILQSLQQN